MGEQSLDRLFHFLWWWYSESICVLRGGRHAGNNYSHRRVEVSLFPKNSHSPAVQHLRLPHLAGTGVVSCRCCVLCYVMLR